jgi:hypothetical protein
MEANAMTNQRSPWVPAACARIRRELAKVTCDQVASCTAPVTHLDNKGYVYCTAHGLDRRAWRPCRKLRAHELRRLERGEALGRY